MRKNSLTPLKAIREKCLDCSGWKPKDVRYCWAKDCSLYPYRFGSNPKRKGIGNQKGGFSRKSSTQGGILQLQGGDKVGGRQQGKK